MKKELPTIDLRAFCSYPDCDRRDVVFVPYRKDLYCKYHHPIEELNRKVRKETLAKLKEDEESLSI